MKDKCLYTYIALNAICGASFGYQAYMYFLQDDDLISVPLSLAAAQIFWQPWTPLTVHCIDLLYKQKFELNSGTINKYSGGTVVINESMNSHP